MENLSRIAGQVAIKGSLEDSRIGAGFAHIYVHIMAHHTATKEGFCAPIGHLRRAELGIAVMEIISTRAFCVVNIDVEDLLALVFGTLGATDDDGLVVAFGVERSKNTVICHPFRTVDLHAEMVFYGGNNRGFGDRFTNCRRPAFVVAR